MNYSSRRLSAAAVLAPAKADALLVSAQANIRYLSGFTGSSGLLVLEAEHATLITDSRYVTQAEAESPGVVVDLVAGTYEGTLVAFLKSAGIRALLYEDEQLKVAQLRFLESALEGVGLHPSRGIIEKLRATKTPDEVAILRTAASGLTSALASFRTHLRAGVSEQDVAAELDHALRRAGYEKPAFETIVASGARSALPHGRPTSKRLDGGDIVVLDFGGFRDGYASDVTRSFSLGSPDDQAMRVYGLVAAAQQRAIELVRPGRTAGEIDKAAREVIEDAGYSEYFGHGTGHGVGLEVHEGPWIRPGADTVLEAGMVFTVEPGIYLPGRLGVRLEDDVLVTQTGFEILSREPGLAGGLQGFSWVC